LSRWIWQAVAQPAHRLKMNKGENMSRTRHVAVASVALAAMALLAGCGGTKTDKLSVDDGPVAGGNGMTPAQLTAHKGHKVSIKVTNTAPDKPHGFSIDEFKVAQTIDPGHTTTVSFKADKAGTYKVYCQLHPTHKPAELVVS
jgi:heme/copper-type cytochrome/quinol oxidase subunit 2